MKYKYYVHNKKENVGVTEYSSNIYETFIDCLIDSINWFMWESDETCFYMFNVKNDKIEITISFDFVDVDGESSLMAIFNDSISTYYVERDNINDFIKSRF